MNELQKKLLNVIQGQFPIVPRPFATLAEQLDSNEAEIIDQITQLKPAPQLAFGVPPSNASCIGQIDNVECSNIDLATWPMAVCQVISV